jgi:hypothetical protein
MVGIVLGHASILDFGKGTAVRIGASRQADVLIIQYRDMEYDPYGCAALLAPAITGQADVVYGLRFPGQAERDGT